MKHQDRLGARRENENFQMFATLKVSGYRTLDKKIRDDSKNFAYGDRFKYPSIKLSNFPRIIGEAWNKSNNNAQLYQIHAWTSRLSEIYISASFSTSFEMNPIETRRENEVFVKIGYERVFGDFSPQKVRFLEFGVDIILKVHQKA